MNVTSLMRTGEKLTENISARVSSDTLVKMRALASENGMDTGEYLRHLIESDIDRHRMKFERLASIFGNVQEND